MPQNKIYKTVRQYNKKPLQTEDMCKLQEIARDYAYVKNCTYQRYSGVGGLLKIYPGYTVQNEMTKSGIREQVKLPSVYFYCAVFEALGDIKTQWTNTKSSVLSAIHKNNGFTPEEKHYLRFVIKTSGCFDHVLNGKKIAIPEKMEETYDHIMAALGGSSSIEKLNKYLCRQVRKKLQRLQTDKADGFSLTERAYRYGTCGKEQGIFLSTKESRKRMLISLTDNNAYDRQLYIRLKPEKCGIEIAVPIEQKIRSHKDYTNETGVSLGMWHMITTDTGNIYGECFGQIQQELVEYVKASDQTYRKEKKNNAGRKKYKAHKAKLDARLETYVNQEINRMIAEEKPEAVYLPKFPRNNTKGYDKKVNYSVNVWKKGFVKDRIKQKCLENSIKYIEVTGKAISTECSRCGTQGKYQKDIFICKSCGYEDDKKTNAAKNAINRGRLEQQYTPVVH